MTIINSKIDEKIHQLKDGQAQDAISAWRIYEEQRRAVLEAEPHLERPVEEGKGQYVDVFA